MTIVEPGRMATSIASSMSIRAASEPYAAQVAPLAAVYSGGASVGADPDQVARFILDVTDLDDPPLHLPMGESAFEHILAAENRRLTELTDWEQVSRSVG